MAKAALSRLLRWRLESPGLSRLSRQSVSRSVLHSVSHMPSQAIIAMAAQHQYDAVATEEGSDESHYPIDEKPPRRRSRYASCPTILQLLPWIIATIAVILLAVGTSKPPSDSQCTAKMSVWC